MSMEGLQEALCGPPLHLAIKMSTELDFILFSQATGTHHAPNGTRSIELLVVSPT